MIDYRRAARIDDALLVRTTYDVFRGAKLEVSQTILRGDEVIATADVHAGCISLNGRPRRPPSVLIDKLSGFLKPAP